MKKNVTYISPDAILALIAESGIRVTEKAGWWQVGTWGAKGPRIYVPKTKTGVGRIDLAGIDYEGNGVNDLGGESFGAVTQQLDFTRPEAEVLETLRAVLDHLKTLPILPPKVRGPRVKKTTDVPVPASLPLARVSKEERFSRLALIARVAKEKGATVSPTTLALCADELPSEDDVSLLPDA